MKTNVIDAIDTELAELQAQVDRLTKARALLVSLETTESAPPATPKRRNVKRAAVPTVDDEDLDVGIEKALREEPMRAGALAKALGYSKATMVSKRLDKLVKEHRVVSTGERRGKIYEWNTGNGAAESVS
jgi:hypothetical protein